MTCSRISPQRGHPTEPVCSPFPGCPCNAPSKQSTGAVTQAEAALSNVWFAEIVGHAAHHRSPMPARRQAALMTERGTLRAPRQSASALQLVVRQLWPIAPPPRARSPSWPSPTRITATSTAGGTRRDASRSTTAGSGHHRSAPRVSAPSKPYSTAPQHFPRGLSCLRSAEGLESPGVACSLLAG